jgi:hypothetical protein
MYVSPPWTNPIPSGTAQNSNGAGVVVCTSVGDAVVGAAVDGGAVVVVVMARRAYTHAPWKGASACTVVSCDMSLHNPPISVYSIPELVTNRPRDGRNVSRVSSSKNDHDVRACVRA